jgi:uncharacterized membrane protein YgcG
MPRLALPVLALLAAVVALLHATGASAQDVGWTIRTFDVRAAIDEDGSVEVIEELLVDFGSLQRHGIIREVPVEYRYDEDENRLFTLAVLGVDDGTLPIRYVQSYPRGYVRLQIGDPDVLVTGTQRYRIRYRVEGALNPFETHDELYWNATGNDWPVPIERATAEVLAPAGSIQGILCFQGPAGSETPCFANPESGERATFVASTRLDPGSGLTFVVALEKGAAAAGPPMLVQAEPDPLGQAKAFVGVNPVSIGVAAALMAIAAGALARAWWVIGRDRWYGDTYHADLDPQPARRPLFAHQTIVVQYQPPEAPANGRRLRPAEIGVLIDERADTLDVSATIVDLAVRKYLLIREVPRGGLLGAFRGRDYVLEKLGGADDELLPYERKLRDALFDDGDAVKLSDLKFKFYEDLKKVKEHLYRQAVKKDKFFPTDPEALRNYVRMAGVGVVVAGGVAVWGLGSLYGAGLIGIPVILSGIGVLLVAPLMPRRTARGWEMYRRCLGFRLYMVTAETDRQRFAEEEHIFHEYLPYAIVFDCVQKWAKTFEALGLEPEADYYVGTSRFVPAHFANDVRSFSTSISGVMASTPGGSGGSGFGGGGFSGGGGGGGGGGSW